MRTGSLRRAVGPVLGNNISSIQYTQGLSTSAVALQQVAPATQEVAKKSSGLLSKLFGLSSDRVTTPLTDPLPSVSQPSPVAPPASFPATESTTLSNGVKVVSEATYGPTATIGIFLDSGSVYETADTTGCSHLSEYMAFKATTNRTSFRIVRELEGLGANCVSLVSREQAVYAMDVIRSNVSEAVEILADSVLNPAFNVWEVNEVKEKLTEDLKAFKGNYMSELTEAMHAVGYQGALSRPLVCPEEALPGLTAAKLHEFQQQNYTANRLVVAASGVSHQELVPLVEPLVAHLPGGGSNSEPSSKYLGGDYRRNVLGGLTHSALGFQAPGGWKDIKTSVGITVLQFLLGGGGSFSSGGPGKGMHSRLYRNVLSNYGWAHNVSAFNSLHNDTGLFGITASCESAHAAEGIDIICKELESLTKNVGSEDLQRAKNAAVGQVLVNLESRAIVAEDIGRQVLTYGHRKPAKEIVEMINAIEPKDISNLVSAMLKTPVTHASIGDVANLPRIEQLQKRFS